VVPRGLRNSQPPKQQRTQSHEPQQKYELRGAEGNRGVSEGELPGTKSDQTQRSGGVTPRRGSGDPRRDRDRGIEFRATGSGLEIARAGANRHSEESRAERT